MALIPINLNDVHEPKPVPIGRYSLLITNAESGMSKNDKPQIRVSIGIEGHDDAPNINHYISLPMEGDDAGKANYKALMLKRFLTLFKIPIPQGGIDPEQLAMEMVGARVASAEVSLESQKDSEGNEVKDGDTYNRLVLPKMRDEGVARVSPTPPKR